MERPGGVDSERPPPEPVLAGRQVERSTLAAALARARAGEAVLAVVEGAAGVGKTALLRDLAGSLHEGEILLRAGAEEAEARLDLGVVEQLVAEARVEVADLPAPTPAPDPLAVGADLRRVVEQAAEVATVVVVVDDAQWCDPASVHALTFALRRVRRARLLAVVAHRPDPDVLGPLLRLAHDLGGPRIRLDGLGAADLRRMVQDRCGIDLPWRAGERLRDHTRGNPLEALTLVEEIDPEDLTSGLGPLPAPRSTATLMLNRLASASPGVEEVVVALAVVGWPVRDAQLAEVLDTDDLDGVVGAAVAEGFVVRRSRAGSSVLDLTHPLLRSAVLQDLAPARRRRAHARAAAITSEPVRGMAHRLAAQPGPDPGLARQAVALARTCRGDGRPLAAVDLLVGAADLLPDGPEADEALLQAADTLVDLGDVSTARELLGRLTVTGRSPHAHLLRGQLAFLAGDPASAERHLRRAWEGGGEVATRAALVLATVASNSARADDALVWARRALADDSALVHPGHALAMVASGWALRGDLAAGRVEVGRWRGSDGREAALVPDGLLRSWDGDLAGARRAFETWIASPAGGPDHLLDATARYALADVLYRVGEWDAALDLAERLAVALDDARMLLAAPMAHSVAGFVLAARGAEAAAEAHLVSAARAMEVSGNPAGLLWQTVATARLADARGDGDGVVEQLGVLAELTAGLGLPEGVQPWRADLVVALAGRGDLDRAEAELAALGRRLDGGGPHARAGAARAEGVLAVAQGDPARADAAFAAGLAEDAGSSGPFVRARLELAAGEAWRRRGRRRAAVEVLARAEERFAALGAEPFLARTRRELAGAGLRPRRGPAARVLLTPAETAVARLVAAGATNREAAAELCISVKTVETHLGRVYDKVGVRSRAQLARLDPSAWAPTDGATPAPET